MTENEARQVIECLREKLDDNSLILYTKVEQKALDMAIQALEEIQQCRAIGTVEEFKALKEKEKSKSRILKHGKYYCCSCDRFVKTSGYCIYCGQLLY